jgi:hypothetical protein
MHEGNEAMAVKLFKLRGVPDDEAEDIRQLLDEHEIAFYETEAGGWGISVPAIWLYDEGDLEQAQGLMRDYQQQRAIRAQAEHREDKEAGRQLRVMDKISQKPAQFVLLLVASLFVLYVSLAPFIGFLE